MLTILTGPPGCGKTTLLLEHLRLLAEQQRPGLLLVPESGSHQAERRLLEVCGNRGGAFATVTTFSKLTEDVLTATGCRTVTLDPGGRVLTMYRALTQVQSALQYYRRAPRPQLVEKLVEISAELMACGITPEQLMQAGQHLSPKLSDLGLIYARYCALCQEGTLDPAERVTLAAQRLRESGLLEETALFVDGFEGFTARKYAFLEQALSCAKEVTVALALGRDATLYTEQHRTLERLRRMARQRGLDCRVEPCPPAPRQRPAGLTGLEEQVYDFQATAREEREGLQLYTLSDPRSECELAAALLRQKALAGVRCREMAVVCGDLEQYGPALSAAFEQYGLPLYLSQKTDLLEKPALQAALGGLNALEEGLPYAAVLDWLRRGVGHFTRDELDRLENYCFRWNIRGNRWLTPFESPTCGYDQPRAGEAAALEALENTRRRVSALLEPLRTALADCRSGRDFAQALTAHLEQIGLEALLEGRCKALRQSGRGREAAETAQLYHILLGALEQLSAVMAEVSLTRREFCRLLQLTLRQYDVAAIPPSLDSVQAVTFERLPGMTMKELVIVGGREGLFPPEKASVSLLSEQERMALEQEGLELTQSAAERSWQQQCALCRALAAPSQGLTVTCPRRLSDGTAATPAFALERLCALRGSSLREGEGLLEKLRLTAPGPLFDLACQAAETGGSGPARAALEAVCRDPERADYLRRLRHYATSPRGPLKDPALVRQLYGGNIRLTASRLERVSTCPMSHFLQYGLKARPRQEARFGSPEIGTFLHYVAERSIPELCRDETVKPEAIAARHVEEYLAQQLPKGLNSARHRALCRQAGTLACRVVRNIWEELQAGDFRPVSFELEFGPRGQLPPMELREGSVTLTVGGKVDRVDGYVRGDTLYLKVVDYKTGKKEFRLSDLLYGLNLQMFLYLLMLSRADRQQLLAVTGQSGGEIRQIVPCGALYIPAKDPFVQTEPGATPEEARLALEKSLRRIGLVLEDRDLVEAMERGGRFRFLPVEMNKQGNFTANSCLASAEQLGRLLRKTERTLRRIAREIAGGELEATPYRTGREDTSCRFCDFREACHFDTGLRRDRLRFLPSESPEQVYALLEEEEKKEQEEQA